MSDQVFNRLSVLKKLRASEPVSRTDLAHMSGLNGGTITAIIRDLVERGLVLEERVPSAGRGRPKVNLRINSSGAFVVGATMTVDGELLADVVDLRGRCVFSHSENLIPTSSLENLAHQMANLVGRAIDRCPIGAEQISQIGVGIPAIVDSRTGVVEYLETFEDHPCPFAEIISREVGIPTRLDNNINLLARSEHWFGEGAGADDFTVVLLDIGLGAARYQSGQLLLGSRGIEAELGHIKIVPEDGRPCHCGGRGCLQAYSSMSAIVYEAAEREGRKLPTLVAFRGEFDRLAERALAGDAVLIEVIEYAGRCLGRGIANHINMQDPDHVVVLSRSHELVDLISVPFFEALHRDTLPVFRDLSRVTFKELDEASYARGAAAMVLEQLYQAR